MLVMEQILKERPDRLFVPPRRLGVADAKSRLSEVLRDALDGPTIIHRRGHDIAVVLAIQDYKLLSAGFISRPKAGTSFLDRVETLKQRHGGGVDEFAPKRLDFTPVDPFSDEP